jgi:thiosulfate/3-mercaptopyruvate sulfurtransferase
METSVIETTGLERRNPAAEVLASPDWLTDHLSDPDLRVVEVDVSSVAYDQWHIDGAVLWNVYTDLKDDNYQTVGPARLEELLVRSGITPASTVVFYGYAPAMGLWLTQLYGHRHSRLLDCSRQTWRDQGRPWTSMPATPPAGEYHLGEPTPGLRATCRAVSEAIGRPGSHILDVRSAAEYRGDCFWPSGGMEPGGRPGHVPSAIHQPIEGLYDPAGAFRPTGELRDLFSSVDLQGEDELITYCTIGGRAATAWFALAHLIGRRHVRVYDGSWAEWGRTPGTPVENEESGGLIDVELRTQRL